MIERMSLGGTPFIGIVAFSTEHATVVRTGIPEGKMETISSVMGSTTIASTVARTDLAGIFLAGNSNGILIPNILEDFEEEALRAAFDIDVHTVNTKYTALGNLVLANDRGCVISPELAGHKEEISSVLGVEVQEGIIAGFKNVGSVAVATNKGCLVHPETSPEKMEWLREVLKVPVNHSTANRGVGYLGGCMIANSKGVVVGDISTGPELGRIDDMLMEE
ncbi:MAG: translation initiation factor IF-6 [Candidatus Methanofastidiosa archaeon]|jgi:translation initiation factor 6|nr:translation initiation factor IF-6 [Candidatus Methanofastidiosa archaeon]MDD4281045.1 translation initiation factor IF-6 [Candidatus Methanofastidiosa archaeon]